MQRLAEAVVVPAGPADAQALARVHVRAWRETYRGLLPAAYLERMSIGRHAARFRLQLGGGAAREVVLAAEMRDGLVGYCAGAVIPQQAAPVAEVFTLYVVKAAQGRGVGRSLMAGACRALAARGATSLVLWVLNGNRSAWTFYERLGGRPMAQRPVRGWGAGLQETRFLWEDISQLWS